MRPYDRKIASFKSNFERVLTEVVIRVETKKAKYFFNIQTFQFFYIFNFYLKLLFKTT
jgi:hypothetical protein